MRKMFVKHLAPCLARDVGLVKGEVRFFSFFIRFRILKRLDKMWEALRPIGSTGAIANSWKEGDEKRGQRKLGRRKKRRRRE